MRVVADPEERAPDSLLLAADAAMYEAKGLGRDQVTVTPAPADREPT